MSDFGITRFGAYVPRLRIDRAAIAQAHGWMAPSLKGLARGTRAFASWDEDAITMAVEAGRDCLAGTNRANIRDIRIASLNFPYADLQHGAVVASALQLPPDITATDIGYSQRSGTTALLGALREGRDALVIAADNPTGKPASQQELAYGAGAAAFRLGSSDVIARLLGSHSLTTPFVDHFRAADSKFDYFWEERWIRDEGYAKLVPSAVAKALEQASVSISAIDHLVMPSLQRGVAALVAKAIGFSGSVSPGLEDGIGYTGAAHALLMLAAVLEKAGPGERILLIGWGQGVDAMVFEVTGAILSAQPRRGVAGSTADRIVTDSYMRLLSFNDGIDLEWGMRGEKVIKTALTEQFRSRDQIDSIVAGKCQACGTVQFPQLAYCVGAECSAPAEQFSQMSLVDEPAQVLTFTADWLNFYQAPPMYVGFMQFDNGARMLTEIVDVGPQGLDVGTPLRLTYRIKDRDTARGYNRYFWKATPVDVSQAEG